MLTEICQYLRNWFERGVWLGDFKVSGGVLTYADGTALPLLNGQYYRVIGSVFNDGVHRYGTETVTENNATVTRLLDPLTDEPEFFGTVCPMGGSDFPALLSLAEEIEQWCADNAKAIASPYQSESFGGYSYSLRGGTNSAGEATGATWQSQFEARLAPYRKI